MPRLVRKVVLYVCTLDGTVYSSRREAQTAAVALRAKARAASKARAAKRGGARRGGQTLAILRAIQSGHKSAADIRRATRVPPQNVHPILHRLKQRRLVSGHAGTYSLTPAGKRKAAA